MIQSNSQKFPSYFDIFSAGQLMLSWIKFNKN